MTEPLDLTFHPLTQKLWRDFEILFGHNGACGGCWCMFWKLRGKAYDEAVGDTARQMHKSIIDSNVVTGLIAYNDGYPIGWIAVEPRSAYQKLAYSRALKPLDNKEVWSITCFFVAKNYRRKGVTVELLKAAADHVRNQGGKIVEGYPIDTQKDMPAPFIHTGTASAFRQAGFKEVARNPVLSKAEGTPTRPIFRLTIK